jgi:hypothetical protein
MIFPWKYQANGRCGGSGLFQYDMYIFSLALMAFPLLMLAITLVENLRIYCDHHRLQFRATTWPAR